ncbi:hypothetical protein [Citrobacter freundii]|uniref:hypothetical protein n=1 Tax=Citrobacter freundii TaxID=546 RepID=UPI0028BDF906|nr:hypothetical protein [Citrobacter freundii]MDT7367278.1 hypothetical protein [Citrobacter freundii]HEI8933348.1 hypothetical protein [Citrobacter freundii]
MSWFKRMLLGLIILAGLIGTLKDYKDFGLFGALELFIIFLLSTTFLWQWLFSGVQQEESQPV